MTAVNLRFGELSQKNLKGEFIMRITKKYKRVVSFLAAVTIAVAANASVAAEAFEESPLTDINGYMCYERDGQYWTKDNGEEYLVIDIDSLVLASAEFNLSENISSTYSTQAIDCPIGKPDQYGLWIYTGWVDLRDKEEHEDRCYLTYGDYYSPIYVFNTKPTNGHLYESRFSLSTQVVLPNTYDITFSFHLQNSIWTTPSTTSVTFSLFSPVKAILTGSMGPLMDGIAIRFEDSSSGQKELYYTINVPK